MTKTKTDGYTDSGFRIDRFDDLYGHACSLQKSSLATDDAVWFGIDDPAPIVMARHALAMGREDLLPPVGEPERLNGWVAFPLPPEVQTSTRMHLSREQVGALLPALMHFARNGELPDPDQEEP